MTTFFYSAFEQQWNGGVGTPSTMLSAVAVALCVAGAGAARGRGNLRDSNVPTSEQFATFKGKFGKSYNSPAEEAQAFANWQVNDVLIATHNEQPLPFTIGHNKFSDMSPMQVRPPSRGVHAASAPTPASRRVTVCVRAPRWCARSSARPCSRLTCGGARWRWTRRRVRRWPCTRRAITGCTRCCRSPSTGQR